MSNSIETTRVLKWDEVKVLEAFLKTLDRFGMMPPYLVMMHKWPRSLYISGEQLNPVKEYDVTIRIVGEGIHKIIIEDEDL